MDVLPYGPLAADHCTLSAGLDPGRCPAAAPLAAAERAALLAAVSAWERWLDACDDEAASGPAPKGYIFLGPRAAGAGDARAAESPGGSQPQAAQQAAQQQPVQQAGAAGDDEALRGQYEDFEPLQPAQFSGRTALEFETFDAALCRFFSARGGQKAATQAMAREKAAHSKLDAIRADHARRLAALEAEQAEAERKASQTTRQRGGRPASMPAS